MDLENGGQSQGVGNRDAKKDESIVVRNKSRRKLLLFATVGAALVLLAVVITCITVFGDSDRKLQEQLDLGAKYLEEMDYEQALMAFDAALEIDPRNVDAYLGIVEVYIKTNKSETALEYAREGYEVTKDECLKEKIDMIEDVDERKTEESEPVSSESQTDVEHEDKEMLDNLVSPKINKLLSVFADMCLEKYSTEDFSYIELLYSVKTYFMRNDTEKIKYEGNYDIISKEDVDGFLEMYFGLQAPDESVGDILYSNNCFYFLASGFGELGFRFSIVEDIQKVDEEKYAIIFYEVYAWPEDYESGELNPIASDWSIYYGYNMDQIKEDKYCEIEAKKRCVLKWQGNKFILIEYGTTDDYRTDNVIEENIVDYVFEEIPELSDYASYISENSGGQASLFMYLENDEGRGIDGNGMEHSCCVVYVGEVWSDHSVNWDRFYVDKESMQIYWYDISEDIIYELDDWRRSSWYRQL